MHDLRLKTDAPTRGVGRPTNPYAARIPMWLPGGTKTWLGGPSQSYSWYGSSIKKTKASAALALIREAGVPLTRRWIEACLVWDHHFDPIDVTRALDNLTGLGPMYPGVTLSRLSLPGYQPIHLYTFERSPLPSEVGHLGALYELLGKVFGANDPGTNRSIVGHAGEVFVARQLRQLGFTDVPKDNRLGTLALPGCSIAVDIQATDPHTGTKFAIEVKNRNETLHPGANSARWMNEAEALRTADYTPWLIVPFATDAAREECKRRKIRLTALGTQVVPATISIGGKARDTRTVIDKLRPIIGPQPVHYLKTRNDTNDGDYAAAFAP